MFTNGYDSVTTTNSLDFWSDFANLGAGLIAVAIVFFVIILALAIFLIIAECKMFKKAGEEWWKALVPVYNTWIETKIAGLAWWWCPIILGVTALSAFVNLSYVACIAALVISFNFYYNISKKFGKSNGFALLCTLLPIIGIPILAFGSDKYNASVKTDKNGIFAVENDMVK